MKNLKQLLTERKYLEAKTLVLENREDLEESIDVMLEMIEDAGTTELSSKTWNDTLTPEQIVEDIYNAFKIPKQLLSVDTVKNPGDYNIGQALYWNDEKKELECKTEDLAPPDDLPLNSGYKWWPDVTTLKILELENVRGVGYSVDHERGSIKFEIAGGDKQEIARIIWEYKQLGIETVGDWTEVAQMSSGAYPISFDYIDLNKPSALEEA